MKRKSKQLLSNVLLSLKDDSFKMSTNPHIMSWQRPWLESFSEYAERYKYAVIKLLEVSTNSNFEKDQLTYPIMFLARHTLELRLKAINQLLIGTSLASQTKLGCRLLTIFCRRKKTQTDRQNMIHSLSSLWDKFDQLYLGDKNTVHYKITCKLIKEIDLLDSQSDTFRYPIHKDGTPTAKKEFVNIEKFVELFINADDFLVGIEDEITQV